VPNDLHYAVVVGINRYPGIGDLGGARADASAFAEWLEDPDGGGLPAANVMSVCVTAKDEAKYDVARRARPTRDEIDYAFQDVRDAVRGKLDADSAAWDRSRLYFYVAGHGFAPQGGEGALFLANAEGDALGRNIELPRYRRWCTTCAYFREIIIFADCCRTRVRSWAPGFGPSMQECPAPWNGKSSTYLIGFGSALGNPTYEHPAAGGDDQSRGYFTGALLEGLRGAAPRDNAGTLTASALSSFVKTIVAERTGGQPFPQEAQIVGELADQIVFGTTLAPPKRKVKVVFPAGFKDSAVIVKDGREIESRSGGSRNWRVELEDGLYEVQANGIALANDGLFKVAGEDRDVAL
jgi:uncharacterized caspase-like protein